MTRGTRRARSFVGTAAAILSVVALAPAATAAPADSAPPAVTQAAEQEVRVDGAGAGRTFDGVGGVSASSSKLLYDYPEPQRTAILDDLFTPNYAASLDILKVEIGGDTNSTTTAEPSHERVKGQVDCTRGYEWWLMREAKRRNPDIKLYGLMWGGPAWLGQLYSQAQVDYLTTWMGCARQNGLHIDYLGGANERGVAAGTMTALYAMLRKAQQASFPDTKIVASDEHNPPDYWRAATWMKTSPAFSGAVDILGEHDVCVWLSTYDHCNVSQDALNSGKPLWVSEQSSAIDGDGADALARAMNRDYIDARVTANINWGLTAGMYPDTATAGTGLILTDTPWSGAYTVTPDVWVDAQTTQFTAPGWRYIDSASGYLSTGASYVTLRSGSTDDYTIVVETTEATAPQTVRFETSGLSTAPVQLWSTNLSSSEPGDWFVHQAAPTPQSGAVEVTLQPGRVYTLSTTTGQYEGTAAHHAGTGAALAQQLRIPFSENFDDVRPATQARYFQTVQGAFEATSCGGGRGGTCYRQVVSAAPVPWHRTRMDPVTVVGDPRWWGDYRVSVDALLEQPGYVDLIGRVENYDGASVSGYHFEVSDSGTWTVFTEDQQGNEVTLAQGSTTPLGVGTWHQLALSFHGDRVAAYLGDTKLTEFTDANHTTGQVGLGVSPYQNAQFDNLSVVPNGPTPTFIPHARMAATATSQNTSLVEYHRYPAAAAIDDRVESGWLTEAGIGLPQSLTLDLGSSEKVCLLAYRPPFDRRALDDEDITRYAVAVSQDGVTFQEVAAGEWAATMATKTVSWTPTKVRFVRLTALASASGLAAAREVDVGSAPCS